MSEGHERFEEFALGHVLGGLSSQDAAIFRAHLIECRDCRLRVAELRDIAADLAATEREARRAAAVATQVARREEDEQRTPRSRFAVPGRRAQIVTVVAVAAILTILFWNYHLRRTAGLFARVVDNQATVLGDLAEGQPVAVEVSGSTRGVAATHRDRLALSLSDLPIGGAGSKLVVWLLDGDDVESWESYRPPPDGRLPLTIELNGADQVVVTVERVRTHPKVPTGRQLARVDVTSAS